MSRGLVAGSLVSLLFLLRASTASCDETADPDGHLVIPLPAEIFGNIFPENDQHDAATLLDEGIIQKWKTTLSIYFAYEDDSEADSIDGLIDVQLRPLMGSVNDATGLGFKRAKSLGEANVVFVFAERSGDVERFLNFAELRTWFGARDDQEFDDIEAAFRDALGFCFRFINAPENEITRAIGFISNVESAAVQEKCLARNLLFAVGLRGKTASSASAKSQETSSRSIGLLDELALGVHLPRWGRAGDDAATSAQQIAEIHQSQELLDAGAILAQEAANRLVRRNSCSPTFYSRSPTVSARLRSTGRNR